MTDQLTDNEVIARFMGLMVFKSWEEVRAFPIGDLREWTLSDSTTYAEKWGELMPVWYKFRDLPIKEMAGKTAMKWNDKRTRIAFEIAYGSISEACKLLADGIRWYNSVKR